MSELIDIRDGITLITTYSKPINGITLFIYVGMCNNILTKWVTQSQWDYKLKIQKHDERPDAIYIDSNHCEILCLEQSEEGWDIY
jgi:hypothetical protein